MAITDRTRKLLWARSGNRCAICKAFLVVVGEDDGETALIGEECHIVARSPAGPRGEVDRPDDIDGCYNLILLCATHHKLADALPEEYTVERLKAIKKAHESWLANIATPPHIPHVRIQPAPNEAATWLSLIGSARELIDIVYRCCAGEHGHDPVESQTEANLVGEFLQRIQDLDIYDNLEIKEQVQTEFQLDEMLDEVRVAGFAVYAGRIQRTLEIAGVKRPWPVAVVRVLRKNNPVIRTIEPTSTNGKTA